MLKLFFVFLLIVDLLAISQGQVVPANLKALPISLHDLRFTDGPLKHAQELDEKWLQYFNPTDY